MLLGICSNSDDEKIVLSQKIICFTDFQNTGKMFFYSPFDVLNDIEEHKFKCNILFIDTNCHIFSYNGVDIAGLVKKEYPSCSIIFYSDSYGMIPEIYNVQHSYFFLFDEVERYIGYAMKQALDNEQYNRENVIGFISNRTRLSVLKGDIIYIKRERRNTFVVTRDKKLKSCTALSDFEKNLGGEFVRCYTGYILNLKYVNAIDSGEVCMQDGTRIPIGRTYKKAFKEKYLQFIQMKL